MTLMLGWRGFCIARPAVQPFDRACTTRDSTAMKVTTKGQVTIPARIRGYLGIRPHTDVDFLIRDGQVVLTKTTATTATDQGRFAGMRGMLNGKLTTDQWMQATRGD